MPTTTNSESGCIQSMYYLLVRFSSNEWPLAFVKHDSFSVWAPPLGMNKVQNSRPTLLLPGLKNDELAQGMLGHQQ